MHFLCRFSLRLNDHQGSGSGMTQGVSQRPYGPFCDPQKPQLRFVFPALPGFAQTQNHPAGAIFLGAICE